MHFHTILFFLLLTTATRSAPFNLSDLVDLLNGKSQKTASRKDEGFKSFLGSDRSAKGVHDVGVGKSAFGVGDGNERAYFDDNGNFRVSGKTSGGAKGFKAADTGSYAKGHNIKGSHNIHKLDEFKKRTDFFDDDIDGYYKERHGGYQRNGGYSQGKSTKGKEFSGGLLEAAFGVGGLFESGRRSDREKGRNVEEGKNGYYSRGEGFNKGGRSGGTGKWSFGRR